MLPWPWPLTFDLETSAHYCSWVGNRHTNFGISGTFRSRLMDQHLSYAQRDIATLTFDLSGHGACRRYGLRTPSVFKMFNWKQNSFVSVLFQTLAHVKWSRNKTLKQLEKVASYKLLGIHVTETLKWDFHVTTMLSKASKRIHFLKSAATCWCVYCWSGDILQRCNQANSRIRMS